MKLKSAEFISQIKVAYEQLTSSAVSTVTGRIKLATEAGYFIYFAKYFDTFYVSEGSNVTDEFTFDLQRTIEDDVNVASFLDSVGFLVEKRFPGESAFLSEEHAFDFDKTILESAGVAEAISVELGRIIGEQISQASASEFHSLEPGKVVSDAPVATDEINLFELGKALEDTPFVSEAHAFSTGKPLQDNSTVEELHSLEPGKVNANIPSASEAIDTVAFGKVPSDVADATDDDILNFGKGLSNTAGFAEEHSMTAFMKQLSDAPVATESLTKAVSFSLFDSAFFTDDVDAGASTQDDQEMQFRKVLTSVVNVTEFFDRTLVNTTEFGNSSGIGDQFTHSFDKPLSDSGLFADDIDTIAFGKVPADTMGLTDEINSFNLSKGTSDVATPSDLLKNALTKARFDTAPVTDAGSLRSHNYSDFAYFAEDYVGTSRSF